MADLIPFSQLATLDNPVFKAAGIGIDPSEVSHIQRATPESIDPSQIASVQPASPSPAIDPSQISHIDDFHRRTVEDLHKDDRFDPRAYFADNPDVAKDPAQLQKLIDVYRARRERGVTLGALKEGAKAAFPTAVKFAKGLGTLANNVFEFSGLQPLFNKAASVVTGDAFNAQRSEALEKESENQARKAYSEFQAATELSATGLSDLGRTGVRKIFGKSIKDTTDQELLAQLSEDAAFQNQLREVQAGRGETLKNAGLDADTLAKDGIQLDSNAIENLSLVDPATVIATAGLFKVVGAGGKILATSATRAGAAKAATALNNLATQTAGKAVQATGRAITATGEGAAKVVGAVPETVSEAAGAGVGLAKTGSVSGAYVGAKAARGIQSGIVKGGEAAGRLGERITNLGEQITGQAPVSAGVQKLSNFVGTYGRPVTGAIKGAAFGTAAAAPLALLADENQTAGGILSGGIALGSVAGGAHGTFGAVTEAASNRYFGAHENLLPAVNSPGYGLEPVLDAAHQTAMETLPVRERNLINNFREGTRNVGGEFYMLDEAEYTRQVAEAYKRETGNDITPELLKKYADTHAQFSEYRPDANGNVRKVVLLNADAKGLLHDAGHLFDASLSPEVAESLRAAVRETFTPEQLADAQARYERRLGERLTPERAMDEFIAEQFNALFHNVPLTEMTGTPSLIGRFVDTIAQGAEALGVDLTAGKTTPSLQNPLSVGLRELFKNAAAEVTKANETTPPSAVPPAAPSAPGAPVAPTPAPAPAPGAPVAPTPAPIPGGPAAPVPTAPAVPVTPATPATPAARNIRVTPAQQDAFAKRAADIGVTEAKANAAGQPEIAARVKEISDSMEAGNPVLEIEHLGIVNEGSAASPTGRTPRRGEQAKGYADLAALQADNRANAPASIVDRHQKTFVPGRWTNQGGTPTLIAFSLDKIISNMHRIVADAATKGVADRIPYENANGKLTEAGWNKAIADAQAYAENQSNGFRGDGRQLTRPTEDLGFSIPAENPDYKPQLLGEAEANFQNLIQGLATPETAREQKGLTPGNIKGQVLAEANKRTLLTPEEIKPRNVGKQEFKSFPGRSLKEVNPLRNELIKAGVDVRQLIEVTERIRAKDVASVKPRPDINFKAPVTDIIRGGFLPGDQTVADFGSDILKDSEAEWVARTRNFPGGLTGGAYRLGYGLKDAGDVQVLKNLAAKAKDQYTAAKAEKNFEAMLPAATKLQFFNEALETATGSAPNKEAAIARILGEGWKPPFPQEAAGEVKFLPRTKAAQDLAEKGFDFRISGQPGTRAVTVLKDGVAVGEFQSAQRDPNVAEISNVQLSKKFRGTGAAEAAYRELLTQLKDDGATQVEGTVVAPEPLALRKKIFGGFDKLELNGEPVSIEDALHAANELKTSRAREITNIEAVNNITPESQFLPKKKAGKENRPAWISKEEFSALSAFKKQQVTEKGITSQFWISPEGKIVLAPDGHLEAGRKVLGKDAPAPGDEYAWPKTYAAMDAKGYIRGQAYGSEAPVIIKLDAEKAIPTAAIKKTMEQLAVDRGHIVDFNERDYIDGRSPEDIKAEQSRFLPNSDPRAIKEAAFRDKTDDQVYPGSYHGEALKGALAAGALDENLIDGFVTNSGEFLTRESAYARALEMKQMSDKNYREQVAAYEKEGMAAGVGEGALETTVFNDIRKDRKLRFNEFLPKPSQPLRDQAAEIAKEVGIEDYTPHQSYVPLNTGLSKQLADFYETAKSTPEDPKVKASYDAFIKETEAQGEALQTAGYRATPWEGKGEPYKSSAEMLDDVRNNKHLFYLKTEGNFGTGEESVHGNPMLELSTLFPGQRVNDVFRWVHDILGHAVEGYEFGPRGEFNAWAAHSAMYTPEAQSALAAETLLQNSWVNFGKHLRDENGNIPAKGEKGFVPLPERPFAEQKNIAVPQRLIDQARGVGEEIKFLPKKKNEGKSAIEFPAYVVPAPQNRGLSREVDSRGITEQFWINSKTGKVILAPDGHEEAAIATVLKDEPAIRESDDLSAVYDAMHARGWVRGVLEPDDTAQPAIHLNGPADLVLGASARRTLDDIAFRANRPVLLNDRQLDIGPAQPSGNEPLFLPKKNQKRDDEGRPLTPDGLIDYERLYKDKIAAERKREADDASLAKYNVPNNQTELIGPKGLTGWGLPNKKFVPLDSAYHENYLAENAEELNAKFGTNFSDEPNVDARLDAINAGFTRFRYEANRGALHVETAAKNWAANRKQILDRILAAEGSVDNLIVNLLNAEGGVVDSISEKLFNLEGTEKLNKIEEALDSLRARGSLYLAKEDLIKDEAQKHFAAQELERKFSDLGKRRRGLPFGSPEREKLTQEGGDLANEIELAWRAATSATQRRLEANIPVEAVSKELARLNQGQTKYLPKARVNIGLAVNGKDNAITQADVLKELERAGVKVLKSSVVKSNTENTVVADLDKPLTPEQAAAVSKALRQDSIAQFANGEGELHGPKAADWRPFNPNFFLNHEGQPGAVPTEKQRALPGVKAKTAKSEDERTALAEKNIAEGKSEFPEALVRKYVRDENGNVKKDWQGLPLPIPVEYDLSNTPLAKSAAKGLKGPEREKAIAAALGDKLIEEYKKVVKNPEIEAGSTWYSAARERLKKVLGDDSKFFAELLGATSPQTGVDVNFKYSLEAYNQFKAGAYDEMLAKYREGKQKWAEADIDDFLRDTKIEKPTRGQFLDWWVKKNNLVPEQSNGKRFGLHSRAVLRVLDGSWRSEVKGPKTPNFTGNLTGETFEATIDLWAARTLHRLANEGNPKRWRILPGQETGVTDPDFYLGQKAYRHAAEKLGMQPDSLQALLWFAEKHYWEQRGWTKKLGAKKSDYNVLLKEVEKTPEGKLIFKKRQASLNL